jgi:hypothetical protein
MSLFHNILKNVFFILHVFLKYRKSDLPRHTHTHTLGLPYNNLHKIKEDKRILGSSSLHVNARNKDLVLCLVSLFWFLSFGPFKAVF